MLQLDSGDIFAKNYRLTRMIDTGGFADVWEAVFLTAGNTVALKIYPKLDAEGIKNIELEYSNQAELSHTNLVNARYLGYHEGYPFLEMRYCSGGNASAKLGDIAEAEIARCIYNIGSALDYLHADDRVHQDIKPNNFLLDKNGRYNLGDLGLSLKLRTTIQRFTTSRVGKNMNEYTAGTTPPCYRAPELCDRTSFGAQPIKATDIWALGASLYELATGELPFGEFGGCTQINNPNVPDLPSRFSKELNFIIKKCLANNTWDRLKAGDLAKLGQNYLETGKWYKDSETNKIDRSGNETHILTDREKQKDNISENVLNRKKKKLSTLLILVVSITLLIAVAAFFYMRKSLGPYAQNDPSVTVQDSLPVTKDSSAQKKTDKKNESKKAPADENNVDELKKVSTDSTPLKQMKKNSLPVTPIISARTNENEISYPEVTTKPRGSCPPVIKKIIRGRNDFKVVFFMKGCLNSLTLYPPGDDRAFYVRTSDKSKSYNLKTISTSGEGIEVPSTGLDVIATFEWVNENVDQIDIIQGKNPLDNTGTTFFNFKGVFLGKN